MTIRDALETLIGGRDLSRAEARAVMGEIMSGDATPAQIAAVLVALRAKGETADEIAGAPTRCESTSFRCDRRDRPLVDVVGTGGDGADTFNVSTAAALVAAAAGAAVAKHGNRAASSPCGSADVLEALGLTLEQPPERIAAVHRRARLRLHVRPCAPSRHAPRRAGPAGARCAHRVQRAGAAVEPGGGVRRRLRCVLAGSRARLRRVAGRARRPHGHSSSTATGSTSSPRSGPTWSSR